MQLINVRNVCEALPKGINHLRVLGNKESSRNGDVIVAPEPVTTIYSHPTERVLFNSVRDANPFFHLMESLWMLNGEQHSKFLDTYISDFSKRFAEPNGAIHDAYGYRWRKAFGFDQLTSVINILKKDPMSRQCVIQMWDCTAQDDLNGSWRTKPCNTHCYFRVNDGALDIMVCCRSNDMIYGAYGANVVHFSILQEYLAARIGLPVGRYHQVSNNFHVYVDLWDKIRGATMLDDRYHTNNLRPIKLIDDPDSFDEELRTMLQSYIWRPCKNTFLSETAYHMHQAMYYWRAKKPDKAMEYANNVQAPDWRTAAVEWLGRRLS